LRKSEWNDSGVEEILREMPKIKDYRDPKVIYQSLSIKAKKPKQFVWFIPSLASATAAMLFFLIIPNMFNSLSDDKKINMKSEVAIEESDINLKMSEEVPENGITAINSDEANGNNIQYTFHTSKTYETAVYAEDLIDQTVITYFVPDKNAQILVPVSIIVPENGETWFELFKLNAEKLTEEQWGLSDYYPINARLSLSDNQTTMNVDVTEGHQYGKGSSNETSFERLLQLTMKNQNQIDIVSFSTNGKPGIMLGNYGEIKVLNTNDVKANHAYYLYQSNNSSLPFLVPSVRLYSDIESALGAMYLSEEDIYGLKPSLSFQFDIDTSSKHMLVLTLKGDIEITNEPHNIYAIEAILLTAKEFGFETVKFENISTPQLGRFNLQDELKVPIAPNKVILP
jgi:hypothetical protein